MQARIVDLLSQVSTDDITGKTNLPVFFFSYLLIDIDLVDLLRYNDEFHNAFKNFDNYMQERDRCFTASYINPSTSPIKKVRISLLSMNESNGI